jgi:hypothetical protein
MKNIFTGKKMIITVIVSVFLLGNVMGVSASTSLKEISAYLDESIHLVINGTAFTARDSDGNKLTPINYNGSTYLPLRSVAEATGLQVKWDDATRTATLGNFIDGAGNQINTSKDKSFQILLPNSWIRNDHFLETINPLSQFGAIKKINGNTYFFAVVSENKSSLPSISTIDDYKDVILKEVKTKIDNFDISSDTDFKVNGYTAKQYEIKGTVNQINAIYSTTIIETNDHIYSLNFWTVGNDLSGIKDDINTIANSFKEITH